MSEEKKMRGFAFLMILFLILVFTNQGAVIDRKSRDFNDGRNRVVYQARVNQEGEMQWSTTFGTTEWESASSLIQTSDGSFLLAGESNANGAPSDMWLVKSDTNGQYLWNRTFGGTRSDKAKDLIQTTDGGFALAGETRIDFFTEGMLLVKTTVNGEEEWNATFEGTDHASAESLVQTTDNGFALAGFLDIDLEINFNYYMWLVKTDTNGVKEWEKTFGGTGDEQAVSLIQTTDGGYLLAGFTSSYGAGGDDIWLVKTDANGEQEWNKTFGGTENERANSLIQTMDGGFAIAGSTRSYGAGEGDMWLVKTDTNGEQEWNVTFGGAEYDGAYSLIQLSDNGFLLGGITYSQVEYNDIYLVRTDMTGQFEWERRFGGGYIDYAKSVIQTSDGGCALAGPTQSYGAGGSDMYLVKTTPISLATTTTTTVSTIDTTTSDGVELTPFALISAIITLGLWRKRKKKHK